MHYFKKNIGEYHIKAGRLCMLEHGAYTLLIDACYDREQFPTLEQAIDWCWARSEAEIEAVKFVLGKFFELKDGVYIENDIAEAVAKYQANADTNRRIAQEREAKRKERKENTDEASTDRERSVDEAPPNYKLRTINQELLTKNQEPRTKKTKSRTEAWKAFYADYPEFRRGGTDAQAWKAANSEGLTDTDYQLMHQDVTERKRVSPNWRDHYAQGITKYIREKIWLTPIIPDTPKAAQVYQHPTAAARPTPNKDLRQVMEEQEAMSD